MEFERKRFGSYLALQWSPSDSMEIYFQAFRSEYEMQWDEGAVFVDTAPYQIYPAEDTTFNYNDAGVFQSGRMVESDGGMAFGADTRISVRDSVTTDLSIGFSWQLNEKLELTSNLQYVNATTQGFDSTVSVALDLPYLDVDLSGERPTISADSDYLANPQNYYWSFTQDHEDDNEAEQIAWRVDASYQLDNVFLQSVKIGVRVTDRKASSIDTAYNWQAIYQPWMLGWKLDEIPHVEDATDLSLIEFDNFFRGDANLPAQFYVPKSSYVLGFPDSYNTLHAAASPNYVCCDDYVQTILGDQHKNEQKENTYSIYGLLNFEWEEFSIGNLDLPIDGNVGVRVVQTDTLAEGHLVYPTEVFFRSDAEDIGVENTYTNVLPSLNLRFKLTEDFFIRLALSKAIARPDFSQLQAYIALSADVKDGVDQGGPLTPDDFDLKFSSASNPDLRPMEADQWDISAEWYFAQAGMIHSTFFQKEISGFIRNHTFQKEYGGYTYVVTQPVNTGSASIKGVELGWSQFFDFLPAPFDGLGLQANYTYIDSKTDVPFDTAPIDTDGNVFTDLPYEGLSKNSYNVIAMYEKGPLSIRMAYNWRSKFLLSVGPTGYNGTDADTPWSLPIYNDDYGQLDASVFYQINESLSIGVEANNLTNSETKTIKDQIAAGDHHASYYVSDTRYAATLRLIF